MRALALIWLLSIACKETPPPQMRAPAAFDLAPPFRAPLPGESLTIEVDGPRERALGAWLHISPTYQTSGSTDRFVPDQRLRWLAEPPDGIAFVSTSFAQVLRAGVIRVFASYPGNGAAPIRSNAVELTVHAEGDASPVTASLRMTGCMGRCPAYTVSVRDDGTLDYWGDGNVKTNGRAQGHLDADALKRLLGAFDAANFAAFDAHEEALDQPSTILVWRAGGVAHGVQCVAAPPQIMALATTFKRAVDIERFIGTASERSALPSATRPELDELLGHGVGRSDLDRALDGVGAAGKKNPKKR